MVKLKFSSKLLSKKIKINRKRIKLTTSSTAKEEHKKYIKKSLKRKLP